MKKGEKMPEYAVVPATQVHIEELAQTMRQADRDEVWAAAHLSPYMALKLSFESSSNASTGLVDSRVLCMFGVATTSIVSDIGVPWLLGSEELPKHARAFLRRNRPYIRSVNAEYKLLVNYVDARHTEVVRWLKWLGFKLDPAKPFGPDQVPFHRFEMRA